MSTINLKQVLEQFPTILQDTKKLKGILSDLFPEAPKGLLRVVVTIVEEGIAEQLSPKQSLSSMEISRYVTKLENDYGYSSKLTEQALALWTEAFAVTTPNAPTPTKASDVKTAEAVSVSTKAKPKMQTKSAVRNFTPTKKTTQTTQTKKTAPLRKVHDPYRGQNKYDFAIEGGVLKKYKGSASSVIIPDIVTRIGKEAFYGCESLKSITIPDSATSIGEWAFGCKSLTSITIPNSVTSIGRGAFSGCESLKSITIPSSVTSIGDWAFSGCYSLTDITIPNSVTSIGERVFSGCESLKSITIPSSVRSIGRGAFSLCTSFTSITIPSSVTSIGKEAFENCKSLTSITIPSSVRSIGDSAFSGCYSLTSITIPSSVRSIGYRVFEDCSELTIYCEASRKPHGWSNRWNPSNCPVVWGYRG